jgi:hypothetical protein
MNVMVRKIPTKMAAETTNFFMLCSSFPSAERDIVACDDALLLRQKFDDWVGFVSTGAIRVWKGAAKPQAKRRLKNETAMRRYGGRDVT